jgi:hypothetical protein
MAATKSGVSRLVSQPSHGRHSYVDRPGREAALRQVKPIPQNHCFVEGEPWSEQYQATNSSIACWYPRRESGEPRLRRTAAFECSRSGMPSLVLGRFFLPFALFVDVFLMIAALRCGGS